MGKHRYFFCVLFVWSYLDEVKDEICLISLGCSKNLVDSENFIGILVNKRGFEVTSELGEADIIIVNTCGFIGDAKKESIETILEVSDLKINGI